MRPGFGKLLIFCTIIGVTVVPPVVALAGLIVPHYRKHLLYGTK